MNIYYSLLQNNATNVLKFQFQALAQPSALLKSELGTLDSRHRLIWLPRAFHNILLHKFGIRFYTVVEIPGNMDDEQIYTLRNFQMKGKRVINRGDSVKSRSRTSLNSRRSRLAFVYFMIQKIRKVFDVMRLRLDSMWKQCMTWKIYLISDNFVAVTSYNLGNLLPQRGLVEGMK